MQSAVKHLAWCSKSLRKQRCERDASLRAA
jgi:hypothetical protein